jgi:hypothetical protein
VSAPQRYRTGGYGAMVEDDNGPWVRWSDAWQPIESAPIDGTVLLVHGARGVELGWCVHGRWYWHGGNSLVDVPTHWMPLPEPPQ